MAPEEIANFTKIVLAHYAAHGRHDLPWRRPEGDGSFDPYKILVSELMLQQTQVPRVIPKFQSFIEQFPTVNDLAQAPLADVLQTWSGLGYNRRAKFLWQSAGVIHASYDGQLPEMVDELVRLPGVGLNTAGAIVAYAFNRPVVFIETNIRTVFIYHFFAGHQAVKDRAILDLLATVLPNDVRTWYWALMDYGTQLKQTTGNLNTLSKHYTKQSTFVGSRRQVRGQVLRLLGQGISTLEGLRQQIDDTRLFGVLEDLAAEGMIQKRGDYFALGNDVP